MIKHICAIYISYFLLFSCQTSMDVNINKNSKLVVEAYLKVGKPVDLLISTSANLSGINKNNIEYLNLNVIFENDSMELFYQDFSSFGSKYAIDDSLFKTPEEGTIKFLGEYQGQLITSITTIPQKTEINYFNVDFNRGINGIINIESIDIYADFPKMNSLYFIELEAQQVIIYNDQVFNQNVLLVQAYSTNQTSGLIAINSFKNFNHGYSSTPFKEKFVLNLYTLNEFHQQFYKAIQSQSSDSDGLGTIFGNSVTEIPSNIENGYGIFTAMNTDTMSMEIPF